MPLTQVIAPWIEQSGLHFGEQRDMDDQGLTGTIIRKDNWHDYAVGFVGAAAGDREGGSRERTTVLRLIAGVMPRAQQRTLPEQSTQVGY
jgi:hypothetical protein